MSLSSRNSFPRAACTCSSVGTGAPATAAPYATTSSSVHIFPPAAASGVACTSCPCSSRSFFSRISSSAIACFSVSTGGSASGTFFSCASSLAISCFSVSVVAICAATGMGATATGAPAGSAVGSSWFALTLASSTSSLSSWILSLFPSNRIAMRRIASRCFGFAGASSCLPPKSEAADDDDDADEDDEDDEGDASSSSIS